MSDFQQQLERYQEHNKIRHWEGERGVDQLVDLFNQVGYRTTYADPIRYFLSDNPGAIEAILEWMAEQHGCDWDDVLRDNLDDAGAPAADEEE